MEEYENLAEQINNTIANAFEDVLYDAEEEIEECETWAETRRIDITRPQPDSISDIQSLSVDRLRDEGRDDLADDLEIWLDHRIMDAHDDHHRLITTHDGVIIAETRRIDIDHPTARQSSPQPTQTSRKKGTQ